MVSSIVLSIPLHSFQTSCAAKLPPETNLSTSFQSDSIWITFKRTAPRARRLSWDHWQKMAGKRQEKHDRGEVIEYRSTNSLEAPTLLIDIIYPTSRLFLHLLEDCWSCHETSNKETCESKLKKGYPLVNMAMENHQFIIGNTSTHSWWISQPAMLVHWRLSKTTFRFLGFRISGH